MNQLSSEFTETVWNYFAKNSRILPWRLSELDGSFDPYKIMVSEVMLQQTQVCRVITKYQEFVVAFPTVKSLAQASLGDVLRLWQGLGYNRRAKFLHESARAIVAQYDGLIPLQVSELVKLPGIGKNTAAAICVYTDNQPLTFIETNIRSVYIHHFFADHQDVEDKDILHEVAKSLQLISDREEKPEMRIYSASGLPRIPERASHYREWYWALMDYGTYLKSTVGNSSRLSKTYTKQSVFEGSKRQIRGKVLRLLVDATMTNEQLCIAIPDQRLDAVLKDLKTEKFIQEQKGSYGLA